MKFEKLVQSIQLTSEHLQQSAVKAVNINMSIRNWLIGYYIIEFEQNGEDRAVYGSNLLNNITERINIKGLTAPELSRCRQFYKVYPQILGTLSQDFKQLLPQEIFGTVSQEFKNTNQIGISQTASDQLQLTVNKLNIISQTASDQLNEDEKYLQKLLISTSFSHFIELIKIDEQLKRQFYELLIIKTTPSVRELQRQIQSLTYERLDLSQNKELAFEQIKQKITPSQSSDLVKSHYFFEFLNINHPQLVEESELEQALINHLQQFIIELGNGFCFEARQKRILIGDEYFFIDLVFYHRILKCHVLIDLKTQKANHEHIGQLKAYINYYKKNIVSENDNPPVGILLVTDQNKTLVEYAIADSDKDILVSKYLLQLPDKEKLAIYINNELKNL